MEVRRHSDNIYEGEIVPSDSTINRSLQQVTTRYDMTPSKFKIHRKNKTQFSPLLFKYTSQIISQIHAYHVYDIGMTSIFNSTAFGLDFRTMNVFVVLGRTRN